MSEDFKQMLAVSTLSHPKVAACLTVNPQETENMFQHSATRRWLPVAFTNSNCSARFNTQPPEGGCALFGIPDDPVKRFNTQPPEGGCSATLTQLNLCRLFQHSATRRWLLDRQSTEEHDKKFQHSATRRWLRWFTFGALAQFEFQHSATRRWLQITIYKQV